MSEAQRVILFLQGPASPFWRKLGDAFEASGARVIKITVSMADRFFWGRGGYAFRGRLARFEAYLDEIIARESITDILLYADRLPYHVIAGCVAKARGIPLFAVENGYLRPDWITLERGGLGAFSHFPNDPECIRAIAAAVPEPDLAVRYPHGFWHEMRNEFLSAILPYWWIAFYPFYRSGRAYNPYRELLNGAWRRLFANARERIARTHIDTAVASKTPYFVYAMQLQGDYQIRDNSPYMHLGEAIVEVIASFAIHAPDTATLIIKQHPHDNGIEPWSRIIGREARKFGIADRVRFIDGGDLGLLLGKARGTVMVNSTVGLHAIRLKCPVKVLGAAIYDMPGLTHQGDLDSFWGAPEPVDETLASDFVRAIAASIQVKGSFFNAEGQRAAVCEIVRRVMANDVNEPGAFVSQPPRH